MQDEELLANPLAELACLNKAFGLSFDHLEAQINPSSGEKKISIKGVFRKGISGDWKNNLTPQEQADFRAVAWELLISQGYEDAKPKARGLDRFLEPALAANQNAHPEVEQGAKP